MSKMYACLKTMSLDFSSRCDKFEEISDTIDLILQECSSDTIFVSLCKDLPHLHSCPPTQARCFLRIFKSKQKGSIEVTHFLDNLHKTEHFKISITLDDMCAIYNQHNFFVTPSLRISKYCTSS